jgi:hypothetical protein
VFARDGGWGVFAAVAGAGEDGGEGVHGGAPFSMVVFFLNTVCNPCK